MSKYTTKIAKEYRRLRSNLLARIRYALKKGYKVDVEIPDIPEEIHKKDVKIMEGITKNYHIIKDEIDVDDLNDDYDTSASMEACVSVVDIYISMIEKLPDDKIVYDASIRGTHRKSEVQIQIFPYKQYMINKLQEFVGECGSKEEYQALADYLSSEIESFEFNIGEVLQASNQERLYMSLRMCTNIIGTYRPPYAGSDYRTPSPSQIQMDVEDYI